jgi:hypothetical protein
MTSCGQWWGIWSARPEWTPCHKSNYCERHQNKDLRAHPRQQTIRVTIKTDWSLSPCRFTTDESYSADDILGKGDRWVHWPSTVDHFLCAEIHQVEAVRLVVPLSTSRPYVPVLQMTGLSSRYTSSLSSCNRWATVSVSAGNVQFHIAKAWEESICRKPDAPGILHMFVHLRRQKPIPHQQTGPPPKAFGLSGLRRAAIVVQNQCGKTQTCW